MTEKLEGMTSMPKNAKKSATPDEVERAAVQQLVKVLAHEEADGVPPGYVDPQQGQPVTDEDMRRTFGL